MPWNTTIEAIAERFWAKIEKSDGCWLWKGAKTGRGYGRFSYLNSPMQAHRMSWLLMRGDIPDGMFVCHTCDVPLCVRPDHLFLGTHRENVDDMCLKNRASKHKLTLDQAKAAWGLLQSGVSTTEVAKAFGITRQSVADMASGQSRRYITGLPNGNL